MFPDAMVETLAQYEVATSCIANAARRAIRAWRNRSSEEARVKRRRAEMEAQKEEEARRERERTHAGFDAPGGRDGSRGGDRQGTDRGPSRARGQSRPRDRSWRATLDATADQDAAAELVTTMPVHPTLPQASRPPVAVPVAPHASVPTLSAPLPSEGLTRERETTKAALFRMSEKSVSQYAYAPPQFYPQHKAGAGRPRTARRPTPTSGGSGGPSERKVVGAHEFACVRVETWFGQARRNLTDGGGGVGVGGRTEAHAPPAVKVVIPTDEHELDELDEVDGAAAEVTLLRLSEVHAAREDGRKESMAMATEMQEPLPAGDLPISLSVSPRHVAKAPPTSRMQAQAAIVTFTPNLLDGAGHPTPGGQAEAQGVVSQSASHCAHVFPTATAGSAGSVYTHTYFKNHKHRYTHNGIVMQEDEVSTGTPSSRSSSSSAASRPARPRDSARFPQRRSAPNNARAIYKRLQPKTKWNRVEVSAQAQRHRESLMGGQPRPRAQSAQTSQTQSKPEHEPPPAPLEAARRVPMATMSVHEGKQRIQLSLPLFVQSADEAGDTGDEAGIQAAVSGGGVNGGGGGAGPGVDGEQAEGGTGPGVATEAAGQTTAIEPTATATPPAASKLSQSPSPRKATQHRPVVACRLGVPPIAEPLLPQPVPYAGFRRGSFKYTPKAASNPTEMVVDAEVLL